jgi:putative solute:sodium symporter small subunit
MQNGQTERDRKYWAQTSTVTWIVLLVWFVFAFVVPWYAAELNAYSFLGFPLGFYMVVQGSLIAFVVLIFVHNWIQDGIDRAAGDGE